MKSRIVIYDIETSFNIGGYFGKGYDAHIAKIIQHGHVLGFAYKFLGQKRIHSVYIWDFPLYKKDPRNDVEVIKAWRELMLRTDIVVGHNSDKFDNRVMMGRLIYHDLPALRLPQSVDTYKATKRIAGYDSYKLDSLMEQFGYGNKIATNIDLWWDCMTGKRPAQREMVRYNKRDVEGTEKVYLRILPHMLTHPNRATIEGIDDICPTCGKQQGFQNAGHRLTKTMRYPRYVCKATGCWVSGRKGVNVQPTHV